MHYHTKNKRVIVSWSGGKDCCFALYKAINAGFEPVSLFTSMAGNDHRTFGHGLNEDILRIQAESLGIPIDIETVHTSDYRTFFLEAIRRHKTNNNISGMVFGDLYLMEHRTWIEDVCNEAGITPYFPLWITPEEAYSALLEFINLGFESIIVKIKKGTLNRKWLGKQIDQSFAIENNGKICPMGENGEFHSFVTNGPIFRQPLKVEIENNTETDEELGISLNIKGWKKD